MPFDEWLRLLVKVLLGFDIAFVTLLLHALATVDEDETSSPTARSSVYYILLSQSIMMLLLTK